MLDDDPRKLLADLLKHRGAELNEAARDFIVAAYPMTEGAFRRTRMLRHFSVDLATGLPNDDNMVDISVWSFLPTDSQAAEIAALIGEGNAAKISKGHDIGDEETFDADGDPMKDGAVARHHLQWLAAQVKNRVSSVHSLPGAVDYIFHKAKRGMTLFESCEDARRYQSVWGWGPTTLNQYAKPRRKAKSGLAKKRAKIKAKKEMVLRDLTPCYKSGKKR